MAYTTVNDPSEYFHTRLYTGTGSSGLQVRNNANAGNFTPDWLWLKPRSLADNHVTFDSSRGFNKQLKVHETDAEDTHNPAKFTRETNGFDIDSTDQNYNQSGATYVAWQWTCNGGSTTSFSESGGNPGGTIQTNTDAGFSIIDYTGTGSAGTISHGLGKVPEWIVFKDRSSDGDDWFVYHVKTGNDGGVRLNSNTGDGDDSNRFNNTSPTTSVFTVGASGGVNDNNKPTIAFCFAPIQGYSKFGSYGGNGSTNGPFVYTGFKPAWVLIKRTASSSQWHLIDSTRNEFNVSNKVLFPSTNEAEQSYTGSDPMIDILSNGFKLRSSYNQVNSSSGTYLYMTFAERPFVTSDGVPTVAR